MESKAVLRLARVSPRKARLVADLVRGRDVGEALEILTFTQKKSARLITTPASSCTVTKRPSKSGRTCSRKCGMGSIQLG